MYNTFYEWLEAKDVMLAGCNRAFIAKEAWYACAEQYMELLKDRPSAKIARKWKARAELAEGELAKWERQWVPVGERLPEVKPNNYECFIVQVKRQHREQPYVFAACYCNALELTDYDGEQLEDGTPPITGWYNEIERECEDTIFQPTETEREPWEWIQPKDRADLIQRLKDGMNYNVPARERENLCSCAWREIEALQTELADYARRVAQERDEFREDAEAWRAYCRAAKGEAFSDGE